MPALRHHINLGHNSGDAKLYAVSSEPKTKDNKMSAITVDQEKARALILEQQRKQAMVDITDAKVVQIQISEDENTVWVNVDGRCYFRAIGIKELEIELPSSYKGKQVP